MFFGFFYAADLAIHKICFRPGTNVVKDCYVLNDVVCSDAYGGGGGSLSCGCGGGGLSSLGQA